MGRTKRISKTSFLLETIYLSFIRASPKNKKDIKNQTMYTNILVALFSKIFRYIIFEGYEFTFRKLGKFYVIKFLPSFKEMPGGFIRTNKPVNFPETFRIRKLTGDSKRYVYYDNEETGGYSVKVIWDKHVQFPNMTFFTFRLEKKNKQLVSKEFKLGNVTARPVDIKI